MKTFNVLSVIRGLRDIQYTSDIRTKDANTVNLKIEDAIECIYDLENQLKAARAEVEEMKTLLYDIQRIIDATKGVNK